MQLTRTFGVFPVSILAAVVAIALWATAPLLAEQARSASPLSLTTLTLLAGALATLPLGKSHAQRANSLGWRFSLWLGVPLLILGAVSSYFVGMRQAPASEAALITYTWPVLFVLLSQWTQLGRIRLRSLSGAMIAFAGAALLMLPEQGVAVNDASLKGYGFAFLAACCWALYSWVGQASPIMLTPYLPRLLLIASLLSALASLALEGRLSVPSDSALWAGIALGLGPFGIAMVAWDKALRGGPSATIGSLAYGVPILAAALLVITGATPLNWQLPLAGLLVVSGCLQASR